MGHYANLRVLDLSGELGLMCGQLLADMGADVQQWVRPADAWRLQEDAHWQAYTRGKGVRLVDWPSATELLLATLDHADVLIETESERFWAELGLPEGVLAERFPALIRVRISYFGSSGPKAGYAATDLIATAASGHLYLSGAADAAPLRLSEPQAHAHASADAAVGVLLALFARGRSGLGQNLDISAQQSSTFALLNRALDGPLGQAKAMRSAYGSPVGTAYLKNQFESLDGPVVVLQGILPPLAAFMERLMGWVHEAGFIDAQHLQHDWGQVAMKLATGELAAADWEPVQSGIGRLIAAHSKAELMAAAVARRLLLAPVFTVEELLESVHLRERGFVIGTGRERRLGPFARLTKSPLPLTENEPALWDEGSSFQPVRTDDPRAADVGEDDGNLPLSGLKVLDVFWVVAGPGATRMLADYGATVVHVESSRRLDMVRNVPPYVGGETDPERAACHHSTNANKLNITLDLSSDEGRRVLGDLIRWADVLTESFAPGVIERMGFGYDAVRALNPDIIMISSSLMGQNGPWRDYAGYGNSAAAVTGFHAMTGLPGVPPTGCFGPYTDFISVRFNALAILSAVDHKRRTGQGQYIDMAQGEAALQFLAPAAHDWLTRGIPSAVRGNRDRWLAPHGVYPALGDDRWIAIAVRTDEEWRVLCSLAGMDALASLELSGRKERQDQIDALLCDWTSTQDAAVLERVLQQSDIPAHRVLDTLDLYADPQLQAREHFLPVGHRTLEGCMVEASRLRFSRTRARAPREAPWFGIHNHRVLGDLLGYSEDIIRRLEDRDVLR